MALLQVHPNSYKKLESPLVIFMSPKYSQEQFDRACEVLRDREYLSVYVYKTKEGEFRYVIAHPQLYISLADNMGKNNFSVCVIDNDKRSLDRYNRPGTDWFIIEPKADIHIIYRNNLHSLEKASIVADGSWSMNEQDFDDLVGRMQRHHDGEFDNESRVRISRNFESGVLKYFREYTAKERLVEEIKAGDGDGITFFKREFLGTVSGGRGSTYAFYSNDEAANPENPPLSVGNKVTLYTADGTPCQSGQIFEIDYESDEAVKYSIEFLFQTNNDEIPFEGKMVLAYNDTQDKVREKVIRGIESGKVPSKYMYETFSSFKGGEYFTPDDKEAPQKHLSQGVLEADLADYLAEMMVETKPDGKPNFPPNDMQMEAIIKGILTEDMLLVLGPPGTGKTTVILAWVNYFVKKGMRVLVSSQNNAAVDNVLERLDKGLNVVRLGQETKIQENCRMFMPMHKQAEMSENCEKTNARILSDMTDNREEIARRRETLSKFVALIDYYKIKKQEFDDDKQAIYSAMKRVNDLNDAIALYEAKIDGYVEARAHKRIFLEESKKKNFLVRFFTKRYVKRVTEELQETETSLIAAMGAYTNSIANYNLAIAELRAVTEVARSKSSYASYIQAERVLTQFTFANIAARDEEGMIASMGRMNLKGELSELYTPFAYTLDRIRDEAIAREEMQHLNSLNASADMMVRAISDWSNAIKRGGNEIFEEILLSSCQVVGATCIGINSNKKFAQVDFDVAIVDESGQIQIHNALVPLSRAPKALMLGDYKQIPPCANDEVISACENDEIETDLLKMSFFEYVFEKMREKEIEFIVKDKTNQLKNRLKKEQGEDFDDEAFELGEEEKANFTAEAKAQTLAPVLKNYNIKGYRALATDGQKRAYLKDLIEESTKDGKRVVNLNSQFRMPGHISDVISEWFYENNYKSSYNIAKFVPVLPNTSKPMVIINTANHGSRFESQPSNKKGYLNKYESELVADIVEQVFAAQTEEKRAEMIATPTNHIGIISAYSAQVRTIRDTLRKRDLGISNEQINGMVASLDSFQGQERDLIIYSLTRSKKNGDPHEARVGFMKELRRLNVAFTRSKKQLVIVGDIDYLKECLYMRLDEKDNINLPCAEASDEIIGLEQINQCASCPVAECERKFARFIRLLMQHVEDPDIGAGDLIQSDNLINILKGETEQ